MAQKPGIPKGTRDFSPVENAVQFKAGTFYQIYLLGQGDYIVVGCSVYSCSIVARCKAAGNKQ